MVRVKPVTQPRHASCDLVELHAFFASIWYTTVSRNNGMQQGARMLKSIRDGKNCLYIPRLKTNMVKTRRYYGVYGYREGRGCVRRGNSAVGLEDVLSVLARQRVYGTFTRRACRRFVTSVLDRAKCLHGSRSCLIRSSGQSGADVPNFSGSSIEHRRPARCVVSRIASVSLRPCTFTPPNTFHNGGRTHEIPRPQPVVGASTGPPAQPRHIVVQARVDSNNMAQGEGGTAVSRETGYIGQEEHRGVAAESAPDLLRRTIPHPPPNAH